MSNTPEVSVVMPVYNAHDYVAEAVSSILAQRNCGLELLIIDDGSTDGSLDVVQQVSGDDERVRVFSQGHGGISAAYNLGLQESSAPIIAVAEHDDRSLPSRLEKQLKLLNRCSSLVAVSSWAFYIGSSGDRFGMAKAGPTCLKDLRAYSRSARIHVVSPTVVFRREAALEVGGFDSRFDGCQDEHLWNRLRDKGDLLTFPEALVEYRLHARSASFSRSFKQTIFPRYWAELQKGMFDGDIQAYATSIRRHRPFTYSRLAVEALGYAKIRAAGGYLADRRYRKGLSSLAMGCILNPQLGARHLRRVTAKRP